mmetsp:Transcript_6558/g.9198  ORF Transcript_6558/g.9198 Transcript_6558/m.9198 type:complete len:342 (-) Transcript_6558:503-1528(-)
MTDSSSSLTNETPLIIVGNDVQQKQLSSDRKGMLLLSCSFLLVIGTILGMVVATLRTDNHGEISLIDNEANTVALSTVSSKLEYLITLLKEKYSANDLSFDCPNTIGAYCGPTVCTNVDGHGFSVCPCAQVKGIEVTIVSPYLIASGSTELVIILEDMLTNGKEAVTDRICKLVGNQGIFSDMVESDLISFPVIQDTFGYNSTLIERCDVEVYKDYAYCMGAPCFSTNQEIETQNDYCVDRNAVMCLCGNVAKIYNDYDGRPYSARFEACADGYFSCKAFEEGTNENCVLQGPNSFLTTSHELHDDTIRWAKGVISEVSKMASSTKLTTSARCAAYMYTTP